MRDEDPREGVQVTVQKGSGRFGGEGQSVSQAEVGDHAERHLPLTERAIPPQSNLGMKAQL